MQFSIEAQTAARIAQNWGRTKASSFSKQRVIDAVKRCASFCLNRYTLALTAAAAAGAVIAIPTLPGTVASAFAEAISHLPSCSFLHSFATGLGIDPFLPPGAQEALKHKGTNYGAALLAGAAAFKGVKEYRTWSLYSQTKEEVVRENAHKKKVAQKLQVLQSSESHCNDPEFMRDAIYLDVSFLDHLSENLLTNPRFFIELLENSKKRMSPAARKRLVDAILGKQKVLENGLKTNEEKREFLEAVATAYPEKIPFLITRYGESIKTNREAFYALLRMTLPKPAAKKAEETQSHSLQVATTRAIVEKADPSIRNRHFLLELGDISLPGMKHVLFQKLEKEPSAPDHLHYMIAKAEKHPQEAFTEAQFLQNTPAFMAVACAKDLSLIRFCSEHLLQTPAFLAALFDQNPQAVKEVLKTECFKKLLVKNKRKIPYPFLKEILKFSHDAKFIDCIIGSLPSLSESNLITLTAHTPSLLKTKLLQSKGLGSKPAFIKAVLRENPWVLHELPRSVKTKKLLGELLSEFFPFANRGRNTRKEQMWLHEELVAAIARDPDCASFVQKGGLITSKKDRRVAYRAQQETLSHEGSWKSRVKTYLEMIEVYPELIAEIPHPGSDEDWERFVIQASKLNPETTRYLEPALFTKLLNTSSDFLKAVYTDRQDSSENALQKLRSQITGPNADLFRNKHFLAELAKIDRKALALLGEEEKRDKKFARELDHKHRLGKGVYNFFEGIEDRRVFGKAPVRALRKAWSGVQTKYRSWRIEESNTPDSPIVTTFKDWFRNTVEKYTSRFSEKKFEPLE